MTFALEKFGSKTSRVCMNCFAPPKRKPRKFQLSHNPRKLVCIVVVVLVVCVVVSVAAVLGLNVVVIVDPRNQTLWFGQTRVSNR